MTAAVDAAAAPTPSLRRRLAAFVYEGVLLFGVLMISALVYGLVTQQRHALYRPTIHMDATDAIGDLQPQPPAIYAELHQQRTLRRVAKAEQAIGFAHHAVHAGDQRAIRLLAIAEM